MTWPAGNDAAVLSHLFFCPKADERDRIDFIYYSKSNNVKLIDAFIVGPSKSVLKGDIVNDTDETFITPEGVWISDHKGNIITIDIK